MLELKDISFTIPKDDDEIALIDQANIKVPAGHFMAIVGPSGCGKSTLLKLIAGINIETEGNVYWQGRDLSEEGDLEPAELGYVPQFSIAYDHLTVEESIESAIRLRVVTHGRAEFFGLVDRVLDQSGMEPIRNRPVKVLSGGQRRRLSLAMELVTDPMLLLCDEVTSGLDPKSEQEIVKLLHQLSRRDKRIVVNVTHSLAGLDLYDSVLVLHEGRVVYHGQPRALEHYFSVTEAEEIYPRLAKRSSGDWKSSWAKHRDNYYEAVEAASLANHPPGAADAKAGRPKNPTPDLDEHLGEGFDQKNEEDFDDEDEDDIPRTPGFFSQLIALLMRRTKIFIRDGGQLFLHVAILVGFPVLVVIFALDGIDAIAKLPDTIAANPLEEAVQKTKVFKQNLSTGGLISGLIMFQVILLTLMGSNNSAREIAAERQIFEKEKLGGLRPSSYLASKILFLGFLVLIQSVWMALFVQSICKLPTGNFPAVIALLILVNAAMTAICLAISAQARTAEQASLLSIYLVGFQLPLSGAVLALPAFAEWIARPFISAYWAWSGGITALQRSPFNAVGQVSDTKFAALWVCLTVLAVHVVVGIIVAYLGSLKNRWEH